MLTQKPPVLTGAPGCLDRPNPWSAHEARLPTHRLACSRVPRMANNEMTACVTVRERGGGPTLKCQWWWRNFGGRDLRITGGTRNATHATSPEC